MFEELYCEKLKFDWNSMDVMIKKGSKYEPLNLEVFNAKEIEQSYVDWMRKLNYLALEYKSCIGPKFNDCPIDDSKYSNSLSIYSKRELRVEINMYLFVGIYFGYIRWNWGEHFFFQTDHITLFKKWFEKGFYVNKIIQKKGA